MFLSYQWYRLYICHLASGSPRTLYGLCSQLPHRWNQETNLRRVVDCILVSRITPSRPYCCIMYMYVGLCSECSIQFDATASFMITYSVQNCHYKVLQCQTRIDYNVTGSKHRLLSTALRMYISIILRTTATTVFELHAHERNQPNA